MRMMGIIFSDVFDEYLGEITSQRTSASLPFGGRYRMIDFVLSNMVNSGITNVGVITKANYQSLMDHLGNGKEWDLDRKVDGLFILPPFGNGQKTVYSDKLTALCGAEKYLKRSDEEYILLADSNIICNIDFRAVLDFHVKAKADITIIANKEKSQDKNDSKALCVKTDAKNRVTDAFSGYDGADTVISGMGMYVLKRELLLSLLKEAVSYNLFSFEREIIQKKYKLMKIMAYEYRGLVLRIDKTTKYFDANMALLDKTVRDELFFKNGQIYTKVRDEKPTSYKKGARVINSLIADGCDIKGTVENSVLFRGVRVEADACVKNSVLMQNTSIGEKASLDFVICDKDVTITSERALMGAKRHQFIIPKGKTV